MTETTAIVPQHSALPAGVTERLDQVKALMQIMRGMRDNLLIPKIDFGIIPGTGDKPSLLLPGMEKLMRALNAVPHYVLVHVERSYETGLFHYEYECQLKDADTGKDIPGGRGLGLCTSYESAFRWRWVSEDRLPEGIDKSKLEKRGSIIREPKWAIDKAQVNPKYGKTEAYWERWQAAMKDGTARQTNPANAIKGKNDLPQETWEMGGTEYRITNPDMADLVNTVMKRAKTRALGDAIKGAAAVSEYFTVDVEDFYQGDWDAVTIEAPVSPAPAASAAPQLPAHTISAPAAPAAKAAEAPKPPAPWYADKEAMDLLIEKARGAGYIEAKQGEKDLLKFLDKPDWTSFATRGDAANAIKAAAEAYKSQATATLTAPIPEPTVRQRYSFIAEKASYDGERITLETEDHGRMVLWSRETLAMAAGEEFAEEWHIRTWAGTKSEPMVYRFDPLKITYIIDGKYPKMEAAEPVDPNDFDAYMGTPEPVAEARKAEDIPY
jgi:hypothetical protein